MFSPGAISSHRSSALNCSSWHAWNCANGEFEPSSRANHTPPADQTTSTTHHTHPSTPTHAYHAVYRALVWQFPWRADRGGTRRWRASAAAGSTARRCTAARTTRPSKCPALSQWMPLWSRYCARNENCDRQRYCPLPECPGLQLWYM